MKEGNEKEAVEYLRKSASAVSRNQNQKGRSYLVLATHYYDKPDYIKAGRYYDSAVFFLDQKYPDYQIFKTKSQNLDALVSQLKIIQTQDSLQRVASMSETARNALISTIVAKIIQDESEGKISEYADRNNLGQFYENERRFQGNIDQEGKWYFYNQAALTFGRTEFRRRWGDRKLEDNWRRSNKAKVTTSQVSANPDEATKNGSDSTVASLDYKKPEFYLKNLPLNDSLIAVSNDKIANALLNAGKAYSERILDPVKATETFESLITRYPAGELVPEVLYNLYNVNKEHNSSKSEAYRQRLLEKYPQSEFARILSDPAYYEKKMADMKMAEKLYQEAYVSFKGEKFNEVIILCDDALKKYQQNLLAPKFMLLRAYAVARTSDERQFREELANLIKAWPGTDESRKAEELIAYLNLKTPELKVEEDIKIAAEIFAADTTEAHVFALIIFDPSFNINLATFDVISYNIDNYTNKNYRTEGSLIENKYIMITVSGFADYAQSFNYYKSFRIENIVRNPTATKMISFIINSINLKALNNDKNPGRYQLFFNEKYLK
jgi:outer membrane protein assembly factor BamD (BamD/ComL family)